MNIYSTVDAARRFDRAMVKLSQIAEYPRFAGRVSRVDAPVTRHEPSYKVRRLPGGLYAVEQKDGLTYIHRTRQGSRNFYFVNGSPLMSTLRDAIFYVVLGGK